MNFASLVSNVRPFLVRLGYSLLLATLCLSSAPSASVGAVAYIDPSLMASTDATLSVIVRGADNTDAAQQVARIGGAVTSDLWLIDSVAASIPRAKLTQLAAAPGIMSLVANHGVHSADLPSTVG
ncbi:MAG: hypothetical protein R2856_21320 [Caldilineaceae bacterium]